MGVGTKLTPVDYLPMRVLDSDATYIYGIKTQTNSNAILIRTSDRTVAPSNAYDFTAAPVSIADFNISAVWCPKDVPGVIFVVGGSLAAGTGNLYKSVDYGSHFGNNSPAFDNGQPVFLYGWNGSSQITSVGPLVNRSFCYDSVNNQYLLGEYNTNGSRVPGSTNDLVRLMKSTNNGTTWSEVAHWNTDGSNTNVRHIHVVASDPYTGLIYIVFGDETNGGIIRWDGVSALASNQNVTAYTTNLSVSVNGNKAYSCDLLFTNSYIYHASDTPASGQTGIWKIAKDLSSITLVNNDIASYSNRSGYIGLKTTDNTLLFTDFGEAGITDYYEAYIFTSNDNGSSFKITGKVTLPASATGGAAGLVQFNNEIYLSRAMAGKNNYFHCAVFKTDGDYPSNQTTADILGPVYWTNYTTGSDSASVYGSFTSAGYRPGYPYKRAAYAMTGNRMTWGSRLLLAAEDNYTENLIQPAWSASAFPAAVDTLPVVIEGQGRSTSSISLTSGSSDSVFLYIPNTQTPMIFKKVKIYSAKGGAYDIQCLAAAVSLKDWVYMEDCTIGDSSVTHTAMRIRMAESLSLTRCIVNNTSTGADAIYTSTGGATTNKNLTISSSIINGGRYNINVQSYCNLTMKNSNFYNYISYGLFTNSPTTLLAKNNIFKGSGSATYSVYDGGGNTETDSTIDYNWYGESLGSITNAGGSHKKTGTNPGWVSAATGNFKLLPGSACINVGVTSGLPATDFEGKPWISPDMGAYAFRNTDFFEF